MAEMNGAMKLMHGWCRNPIAFDFVETWHDAIRAWIVFETVSSLLV